MADPFTRTLFRLISASEATLELQSIWNAHRERIEAALREQMSPTVGCPERLRQAMSYSLLAGGKRLRPVLTLLACEACGGDSERALPAACAVEMVHTYSLIHDDLPAMDDDDLRRGKPTCHRAFGEDVAILAGDGLLTLAFETIARNITPPEVAAMCCLDLATASGWQGMVGGQMADLEGEGRFDDRPLQPASKTVPASPEDRIVHLRSIHARKTGCLITSAVQLGCRVAGGDAAALQRVETYGKAVGLAFQITDDLLDITGDVETMGKDVQKDAAHGKLTYPGLMGLEESRRLAEQLVTDACDAVADFGSRAEPLQAIARFFIERNH